MDPPRFGLSRTSIVAGFLAIVLGLAVGVLIAVDLAAYHGPGAAGPFGSQPAPTERVSQSGAGASPSASFDLAGSLYDVQWTVTPHDHVACLQNLTLEQVKGSYIGGTIVSVSLDGSRPQSGRSVLDGVPAGSYYVSASADCGWAVTLIQVQ